MSTGQEISDPVPEWTDDFSDTARREGWGIDGDTYLIVTNDDAKEEECEHVFADDDEAHEHVRQRAAGSEMHRAALAIHERNSAEPIQQPTQCAKCGPSCQCDAAWNE